MTFRIAISLLALTAGGAMAQELPQASNQWFSAGQAAVEERLSRQPNVNRAKNVILLVSDGNGVGTNYATRLFSGQQDGGLGDEYVQPHEDFPYLALVKTYSSNGQTPDSAPTATAMNSGIKTKNDLINVTDAVAVSDCAAALENGVTTLAEMLSGDGKSVGVVSTARITHATPAAVYARTANRDWEDDTLIPAGCEQLDIAAQLAEQMNAGVIDVAMGGGRAHFIPAGTTDSDDEEGVRGDERNLPEELIAEGGAYVQNQEEFDAIDPASVDGPILGLFEASHMQYEADRAGEPSLAEMTAKAIEILAQNEEGFYLEIEGGRIDHANHAGNLARAVIDGKAFADAVAIADEMTNDADTLIIVTADHEHALAFNGYCGRGSSILGLCMQVNEAGTEALDQPNVASDGLPYTVAGFLNGAGSVLIEQIENAPTAEGASYEVAVYIDRDGSVLIDPMDSATRATVTDAGAAAEEDLPVFAGSRPPLTEEEATDLDYLQQALVPMSSETHSGEDVAVYAKGPFAHLFDGTIEQNEIFHVMRHAATAEE